MADAGAEQTSGIAAERLLLVASRYGRLTPVTTDPQRAARARILPDNWKVPVFGGLGAGLAVVAGAVIDEVTDSVALRILTMVLVILGVMALGRPYASRRK